MLGAESSAPAWAVSRASSGSNISRMLYGCGWGEREEGQSQVVGEGRKLLPKPKQQMGATQSAAGAAMIAIAAFQFKGVLPGLSWSGSLWEMSVNEKLAALLIPFTL